MQFKLALVSFALATLALASPAPRNEPASDCSTGDVQCCSTPLAPWVTISGVTGLVGLTCSGINVAGGGTCNQQAVCCTDNSVGVLSPSAVLPLPSESEQRRLPTALQELHMFLCDSLSLTQCLWESYEVSEKSLVLAVLVLWFSCLLKNVL
ncbi:hypothetical protein BDP27DRAFT_1450930 [Rhodocollybia butyracea]|uniref:Hydrophobin n=1 Tax=Rhodocollybia butyracea TaxID=206335 RepID=A0A9P5PJ07_9AGAR|nr:hypothetical protein BDP27DRAFT_1450930 [Rhodocollybia butyracea]